MYGNDIRHGELDTSETTVEPIDPDDARQFLGDSGNSRSVGCKPRMEETTMPQDYTSGHVARANLMGKLGKRNDQTEQSDDELADAISSETLGAIARAHRQPRAGVNVERGVARRTRAPTACFTNQSPTGRPRNALSADGARTDARRVLRVL